jgi:hypothetical protein
MKLAIQCWEPVQAHAAMTKTIWPQLKSALMAGHKMVLEIKPATRSLKQNARFWAMLDEISEQIDWYGRKLTPEEWKHVFTAALKKQDVVPGLDGGFVVLGQSTSNMSVAEMTELIELCTAFGTQQGVKFRAFVDD